MTWWIVIGVLLLAYFLGSIPTGFIVAKLIQGIDIREHGSGNTGATNVFRVVGRRAGVAVLIADLLKGLAAVLIAHQIIASQTSLATYWVETGAGMFVILGHSRSIWLNFTGGKSAATGLGVLLALAYPVGLGAAAVFAGVFALSKTVSLGSISAALITPILMLLTGQPLPFLILALIGGLYVVVRHRSNISRLLSGTEPKISNG